MIKSYLAQVVRHCRKRFDVQYDVVECDSNAPFCFPSCYFGECLESLSLPSSHDPVRRRRSVTTSLPSFRSRMPRRREGAPSDIQLIASGGDILVFEAASLNRRQYFVEARDTIR